MKTFIRLYPIGLFFLLTLFIGYYPWWGFGIMGFFPGGMSIAGVIIVALAGGWKGLKEVLQRWLKWRVNWRWYAAALLVPALVSFTAVGVHILLGGKMPSFGLFRAAPTLLLFFILALFDPSNGPVGEELFGLRGYAQPELQKKMRPVFAALIVGTFFGAWHFPEFFRPGSSQYAIGFALYPVFILTEIAHSAFQAWIYNRSGLEDPRGVFIIGTSKFGRKIAYQWIEDVEPEIILDFIRQALGKLAYFKEHWKEIQITAFRNPSRPGLAGMAE